ncbi:MAG TPA: glycosyltransferase, partial [Roseococcus sp.]|nr:glycosyltransferase [Roseococcus sp.]
MPGFDPITDATTTVADLERLDAGPPYRGGLDHLQLPYLSGWAIDLRDPGRVVGVVVLVDGLPLVHCEARERRDDIARFVPSARPGFRVDLLAAAPGALAAVVGRLLRLDAAALAAPAPIALRLDDEAKLLGGTLRELSGAELLALLMRGASPALTDALETDAPARTGPAGTIAALSTELLHFDELAYLRAHPDAADPARGVLGAALRHCVGERGKGDAKKPRLHVTPDTKALLLAELALAEGRPGGARHWVLAALFRLLGPQPADVAKAIEVALTALEVSGAEAGPPALLARAIHVGALALGPEAAGRLLPRLAAVSVALHPAHRAWPTPASDLHWWGRLAPLLVGAPTGGASLDHAALRALCLDAWRQPSPTQRQAPGTPVPPTNALRRLLLIAWAASAHVCGAEREALAAALSLSRELLGVAEQPWRSLLRRALRPHFESAGPVPAAALAAILCAGFEGAFGPRRLPALGALLRRIGLDTAGMQRLAPREPVRGPLEAAFLIGMRDGESHRYRVLNIADALEDAGAAVTTVLPGEEEALLERCTALERLVVFRAALEPPLEAMLGVAHRLGARLLYDIDDLVFDPGLAPQLKALELGTRAERAHTLGWMRRYREAMLATEAATGSTAELAARMSGHDLPAHVVPNTHGPFERAIAAHAARDPAAPVTIAYFSGTWTHHADFAECDGALRAVLARHPEVRFLLAGNLQLGPEWDGLAGQVDRAPFLPHPMMLGLHAQVDVMLAPLELGNAFCDSKSELKIFEAALFGVPSVASPTGPYAAAIEDGVSGLLAATATDWEAALERLLADPAGRARMGEAARQRALRDFDDARAA